MMNGWKCFSQKASSLKFDSFLNMPLELLTFHQKLNRALNMPLLVLSLAILT